MPSRCGPPSSFAGCCTFFRSSSAMGKYGKYRAHHLSVCCHRFCCCCHSDRQTDEPREGHKGQRASEDWPRYAHIPFFFGRSMDDELLLQFQVHQVGRHRRLAKAYPITADAHPAGTTRCYDIVLSKGAGGGEAGGLTTGCILAYQGTVSSIGYCRVHSGMSLSIADHRVVRKPCHHSAMWCKEAS